LRCAQSGAAPVAQKGCGTREHAGAGCHTGAAPAAEGGQTVGEPGEAQ